MNLLNLNMHLSALVTVLAIVMAIASVQPMETAFWLTLSVSSAVNLLSERREIKERGKG